MKSTLIYCGGCVPYTMLEGRRIVDKQQLVGQHFQVTSTRETASMLRKLELYNNLGITAPTMEPLCQGSIKHQSQQESLNWFSVVPVVIYNSKSTYLNNQYQICHRICRKDRLTIILSVTQHRPTCERHVTRWQAIRYTQHNCLQLVDQRYFSSPEGKRDLQFVTKLHQHLITGGEQRDPFCEQKHLEVNFWLGGWR